MNLQPNNKSTSEKLLDKIKKGELKKHSKYYFVFRTFLWGLGAFLILIFSIFLGSFIVFSLRASGALFLPLFGFPGMRIFLFSFPWLLILIVVFLVLLIEGLVKKFPLIYRKPLLYSILGILIVVLVGSFVLDKSRLHVRFLERAQDYRLPLVGSVYRGQGMKQIKNTYIGRVTETTTDGFYIIMNESQKIKVLISKQTKFIPHKDIGIEDVVLIFGEKKEEGIVALGIKKIENIDDVYWRPMNHKPRRIVPPGEKRF